MLDAGALVEAKEFSQRMPVNNSLSKALGYPELLAYLAGKISLAEATTLAQQSTRNYAKRQTTWFKNQIKADIVLGDPDPTPLLTCLKGF